MMDRMEELESKLAHLMRAVDDLSDIVARQSREIDRLTRLTALLSEREGDMASPAAHQPPPHY